MCPARLGKFVAPASGRRRTTIEIDLTPASSLPDAEERGTVSPTARTSTTLDWVLVGSGSALFAGGLVKLTLPVRHGAQVMVTLERSGGVDAPTQQPLLRVRA